MLYSISFLGSSIIRVMISSSIISFFLELRLRTEITEIIANMNTIARDILFFI